MAKKISKLAEHNILNPSKKPADMPLVAWQFALRKQFGQGNI
jgi:hypothetical protein